MNRISVSFCLMLGVAMLTPSLVYASSMVPQNQASDLLTDNGKVQDDLWHRHYSYAAAQRLQRAGVLTTMSGRSPEDHILASDFVHLLQKVTGGALKETDPVPAGELTRSQAAAWVYALTRFNTGIAGNLPSPFRDVTERTPSWDAISYVYHTGIMGGDGISFFPQAWLTWGQTAVILDHVLQRMPQMATPLDYDIITDPLPESVYTLVQKNRTKAGVYSISENGYRYIVVAGGEKPTGGYTLSVDGMWETKGAVYVRTTLHVPAPGEMVPQLITYPCAIVRIQDTKKPVYWLSSEEVRPAFIP